ncbi:MAG: tetratricopeptide repeat protein [Bacteroidota bacterium]|jgi:tetratricopeptide (TPR) repeat protein|nr:tetratricopeptide repeat protein [Bacteroidota bacterium]
MKRILFSLTFLSTLNLLNAQDLPTIIKNGEAKLASSDFAGAEVDFATAIRLNDGVTTAYLEKMKKYGTMNEFQRSSSDMPDGFIYDHQLALPFYGHGLALQGLGKSDEALTDLEKAISIDPKFAAAICERGVVEITKGMKDKGCIDLRKAKVLGNEKAKSLYETNACSSMSGSFVQAGDKKFENKDYAGALAEYTSAIQLNSEQADPYIKRGVCNVTLKKYDKAVNDYNKALKINQDTVKILYLRGLSFNASGNYKSAFDDFSKVIRLDPNNYDAYMQRGAACEGMENYRSASYDYSEAVRIKPSDGLAYYKRGLVNQDAKDNSACKDFKTAASLGFEDAKSLAEGCGVPAPKK